MEYSKQEILDFLEEKVHMVRPLTLQWHITDRCNFRCKHCYQQTYQGEELPFHSMMDILEQYKVLLEHITLETKPFPVQGVVNITGGEPFVHEDFWPLLDALNQCKHLFHIGILTNGSMIDKETATRLSENGVTQIQVSIEGSKETNDAIRSPGAYDKAISAIKNIIEVGGISTSISFTASKTNFREFKEVARLGCEIGATSVWSDRLVPEGSGEKLDVLSPEETKEYISIMHDAKSWAAENGYKTNIRIKRALQFLGDNKASHMIYHCGAADRVVVVMPNGDLYPCRRMPIAVGNLTQTSLKELYYKNDLFLKLRRSNHVSKGCEACEHLWKCRGGLKCFSYAMTGNPFTKDPGCFLLNETSESRPCC